MISSLFMIQPCTKTSRDATPHWVYQLTVIMVITVLVLTDIELWEGRACCELAYSSECQQACKKVSVESFYLLYPFTIINLSPCIVGSS